MPIGEIPATVFIGNNGKPELPDEPFLNVGDCRTYCNSMVSADLERADNRSKTDGQLAGFPPIPAAQLTAKKMSWMPNVGYRGLEGFLAAPQTAFYDLVTEADPCIDITLDFGKGQEQADWEDSIEKHWTWLLMNRWRLGLNFHIPLQQREMLVHGIGAHVWPQMNVANWIERTPKTGHILFPEGSPVNFESDGESFMLRDFVSLHKLYGWIKNEKAARVLGWNPDVVWKTMALVSKNYRNGQNFQWTTAERWVKQARSRDIGDSISRQSGVWIDWIYVREIGTSKVSLYAIPEGVDPSGYLFKKRNLFDTWPLAMFPYDIGDGTLHSIIGLGDRSRDFFALSDRTNNSMAAQVILGATVMLQQTGTLDPAKLKLMKIGMMSVLPQNLQLASGHRFPDLSQGPLALSAHLKDTLNANTQSYSGGAPEPLSRETGISYQMRAQDSAKVSKGAHGLYGSHWCNYQEIKLRMVLRAAKMSGDRDYIVMAKEFKNRCLKDGVPEEAFEHIVEVKEVMSSGAGSAAARIQNFQMLFQTVYPNTTTDRQINILRDYTATLFSGSKVDRYAPSLNDHNMTTDDDSIIALENDALSRGGVAVVSPHQNQVRHADGHLQAAGGVVQAAQQEQMQPEEALASIKSFGQHIAAHLQNLKQNPTKEADYKRLQKELLALASIADKMQHNLQEQQDANQPPPQQQLSEKGQLDMQKAQNQEQVRNLKAQGHEQRAWRQQQFNQQLADRTKSAEIRRQNTSAVADIQRKNVLAVADTTA